METARKKIHSRNHCYYRKQKLEFFYASGLRVFERCVMACTGTLLAFRIIAGRFFKRRLFSVMKSDHQNGLLVRVERDFFRAASFTNSKRDF